MFLIIVLAGCVPVASQSDNIINEEVEEEIQQPEEAEAEIKPEAELKSEPEAEPETEPVQPIENSAAAATPSPEVLLAQCLTNKGVKLYTSRTCPHCTTQKSLFKDGVEFLINVDCLNYMGTAWISECTDNKIEAVPTWLLASGEKLRGLTALDVLAQKTGCVYTPAADSAL